MIRPNIVMDPPPTTLTVGGLDYSVETDYRVWIEALGRLKDLLSDAETDEQIANNAIVVTEVCAMILGKPIRWESAEQIADFIRAVAEFSMGYPQPPAESEDKSRVQTYSFDYDINAIAIAFMKYYGVDITYRSTEKMHWWIFLEYFRNLCGNDLMILRMMEIRGYEGKDKDLKRLASRYALPVERSADEEQLMQAIADEFYGAH